MAFSSRLTLLCDHEYRLRTYVVVVSEYVGVRYAATMWRKIARQKERETGGGGLQQETEREREACWFAEYSLGCRYQFQEGRPNHRWWFSGPYIYYTAIPPPGSYCAG